MVEMILEVSHLSVCRRGITVVEDVSFSLAPETDTALVGPNGAGKSTLVMALLGVLPRSGGEVRLLGNTPSRAITRELLPAPFGPIRAVSVSGGKLKLTSSTTATPRRHTER